MQIRFAFAVALLLCAQATVTASTSYTFGSSTNASLASDSTPYVSGFWTEAFFGTTATTTQQIDCIVTLTNTTNTCGNPGPGSSAHIGLPAAPGNRGILPTGTTSYLEVDGDPTYGAPVWTAMQNLVVGVTYTVSFYQASNEESGNNKSYNDSWEVYVIPGSGPGPYLCPQSFCAGISTQTTTNSGNLAYTSTAMANAGRVATNWQLQSFNFKATSSTEVLEFVTNAVATTAERLPAAILRFGRRHAVHTRTGHLDACGAWRRSCFDCEDAKPAIFRPRMIRLAPRAVLQPPSKLAYGPPTALNIVR